MANIVDSLVVTLGLESKKFSDGQKDAIKQLKELEKASTAEGRAYTKTQREKEAASTKAAAAQAKQNKESEKHFKEMANQMGNFKSELLKVGALLTGGFGLASFVKDTITTTAALSRSSANLGMNALALSEWEHAAVKAGGTAEGVMASLQKAQATQAALKNGEAPTKELLATTQWGSRYGFKPSRDTDASELLKEQADIIKNIIRDDGITVARSRAEQMGINEDMFNLLKDGRSTLQEHLDAMKEVAQKEADLAPAAEATRQAFVDLENELKADAIPIVKDFVTALGSPEARASLKAFFEGIETATGWFVALGQGMGNFAGWIGVHYTKMIPKIAPVPTPGASGSFEHGTSGSWGGTAPSVTSTASAPSTASTADHVTGKKKPPRNNRNHNPGNITKGRFADAHGAIGSDGDFAVFPDDATGSAAQRALLDSYRSRGYNTIAKIVGRWSPPDAKGNTSAVAAAYIKRVSKDTGIDPNAILTADQLAGVQNSMTKFEGWRGNTPMDEAKRIHATNIGNTTMAFKQGGGSSSSSNSSSSETHIGTLNVNTQATDANGIAGSIVPAVKGATNFGMQNANAGLT